MNCFNHTTAGTVGVCKDCNKGLIREMADLVAHAMGVIR